VLVERIEPTDDAGLAEGAAVLAASDKDLWPELAGFSPRDIAAFARFTGKSTRYVMVGARLERDGPILGVGLLEFPLLDNTHSVEVTVAVHPGHRRRGVGTALVEHMAELARADGRRSLNGIVDIPVARAHDHASLRFAPAVGFVTTLAGNTRRLDLPLDPAAAAELRRVVASARNAADYRMLSFPTPWPEEFAEDEWKLLRVMSTDEPAGDDEHEEEVWDAARMAEYDQLRKERGATKLCTLAQHVPSGRAVAMTEILVTDDEPHQCWQLITVVHPEHRGHRLGLAVKLANLEFLARHSPGISFVVTGNAAVNAPMIAVNDMMGFRILGEGFFWQKHLQTEIA
jgi:GNAT superfamily N-acetyltransferase